MSNLTLEKIGKQAKSAEALLRVLSTSQKNKALVTAAEDLVTNKKILLEDNAVDIARAKENQMAPALVDRLLLTETRIAQMAEGLKQMAELEDPVGEVLSMKQRPNGLMIGQKRVPLGVIGIIYESRPNVTADAFGLCFKAGNVVILRGGKDAIHSNQAITRVLQEALIKCQLPAEAIQLITDTSHQTAEEFMCLNRYVDVLIPRGGAGLIRTVVERATVPVIETGTGNCHIYVDETADLDMAVEIIFNAKTQRIGVCNACESLVIHEKVKDDLLPKLVEKLKEKKVELRGDEASCSVCPEIMAATENDWGTEYLDYVLSIKTVSNIEEAIAHINRYNTGHSEAIITRDYENSQKFLDQIDAAAVYVNASTRFTDGFEFGFGGEIGISTQKLHARGPMGLKELTSTKYIIYGNGQIRP
ncbi:MAG: glutamate-5-semialdehyde dehydrogenase [Lachnospiraceae bacterium]|nr:glutamate-5-semialdehyde dehydrogenase [Lachnospiraceae bacterium]